MSKNFLKTGLAMSALFLYSSLNADEAVQTLDTLHVYGHKQELALPNKEIGEGDLQKAQAGNLSKLLEEMPGINNASFGEGVGRPVIRGMSANRVKLSVNGSANADVSNMSSDHAPMMEMANAEKVEVIYGPNTLRFGSGAMGGLVNVEDGRFHQEAFTGIKGQAQTSIANNAKAKQFSGSVDIANANEGITKAGITHFDFFSRQSDNFYGGEKNGVSLEVPSSGTEAIGGSVAHNFVETNRFYTGLALGYTDYEYGIPNNQNEAAFVAPEQMRLDFQAGLLNLSDTIEKWESKISYIDYNHEELIDGNAEALFEKSVTELQSSLFFHFPSEWIMTTGVQVQFEDFAMCHNHGGCPDIPDYSSLAWNGETGANLLNDSFGGFRFSHSTPMPLSETFDAGLFVVLGKTYDTITHEMGLRYDSRTISTDYNSILPSYRRLKSDYSDKDFHPVSLSTGVTWDLGEQNKVALNLSHSERAPAADEMFYNGDHHATFSYQLDNLSLEKESAKSIDLTWQTGLGNLLVDGALFYYDFEDYIYNDLKPVKDPYHGRDVYRYEQADARFLGGELTLEYLLQSGWIVFTSYDTVSAQLKQGANKNLPRTPPSSLRSGVKWQSEPWTLESDVHYFAEQDNVASNETPSDAFSTLNFYLSYLRYPSSPTFKELNFQIKAKNILDEYGVNHTSYLKNISPVQGRNIEAGIAIKF